MRIRQGLALIVIFTASAVSAQSINFTSSRYETVAKNITLHERETSRFERFLTARFPNWSLRREARAKQAPSLRKVNYEVVYHIGVKYLVAVYTSRYDEPVNMMAVYQMSGERAGKRVWRSRTWTSNYYGNSLTPFKSGSRTLFLFKEGGIMPGDFGLASVFSLLRYGGRTYVKDNTPANTAITARTVFPFRAILGQNIQINESTNMVTLTASESMYRFEDQIYQETHEWQYDRRRNSFQPVRLNAGKLTKSN